MISSIQEGTLHSIQIPCTFCNRQVRPGVAISSGGLESSPLQVPGKPVHCFIVGTRVPPSLPSHVSVEEASHLNKRIPKQHQHNLTEALVLTQQLAGGGNYSLASDSAVLGQCLCRPPTSLCGHSQTTRPYPRRVAGDVSAVVRVPRHPAPSQQASVSTSLSQAWPPLTTGLTGKISSSRS